ncbi:MAG: hypothetical protein PVI89_16330, partial [Desulfobacteraceae bacterium]
MTVSDLNTTQADWSGASDESRAPCCDSVADGKHRRRQSKAEDNAGARAFVPTGGGRRGAGDVKAMIAPWDQKEDQNHNESRGGGQDLAEIVDEFSQTMSDAAQALQSDRLEPGAQSIASATSCPDSDLEGKLTEIKARIADLLDQLEALQPGFAKDVASKVEPDMAAAPVAKSEVGDREALLASFEVLADLLEELVELLRNGTSEDAAAGSPQEAMEAVTSGYETAAESSEPEKESRGVEMFMAIYDQLSPDARMEVVEILAGMVFEGNDTEPADYRDTPAYQTLQSYREEAFDLLGENDAVSFEFLADAVGLIVEGGFVWDRFDLNDIFSDMPQAQAADEMEAFLTALEESIVLLDNGQGSDALDRLSSAVDQSSLATRKFATEFLVFGLGAKAYARFFSFNTEGMLEAVTPFDQEAAFDFARELEHKTENLVGALRDLNMHNDTRSIIIMESHKTLDRLKILGEAEDTMATALYDIESDSPGFLDDLLQMISDNHTQASLSDSTPPGFDNRIDQSNGIDQMMMRAFLSERHFNSMWESFLDLSSLAGQIETWIAQEGAGRA